MENHTHAIIIADDVKAALFKMIDYGVHHPESSQGGGIKNKNKNK